MNKIKLSIIIVNFNTKELLSRCLNSIFSHPCSEPFEVLVVDNASSDGSSEMIKQTYPQVKLISNQENVGFARANNRGLREAKGIYILLLNSDTEVQEGSLQGLVNFMDYHPKAGAAGCQLLLPDGTPQSFTYGKDPTLPYLVKRIFFMILKRKYLHRWSGDKEIEIDWVTGACMIVRKKAIDSAGYLDENIFMYFEDNDWCYRIRGKGWKIYFVPQIRVLHLGGRSLGADDPQRKADYYKSLVYFYKKHYGVFPQVSLRVFLGFYRLLLARQVNERIKRAEK